MKLFLHRIVIKKLDTLRFCTLVLLCALAFGMLRTQETAAVTQAERPDLRGLRVAVDPGHGGYDGGARARDSGVWEKELTLSIALEVEKELTACGAHVILTRREDVCLADGDTATKARKRADLQRRLDIADEQHADVFLSIHLNEYRDRSESGPQVFYQKGADKGRLLSGFLQQAMIDALHPSKIRKAMAGDYYVLRGKLPSALVDCGFLSNSKEEKLLLSPDYHRKIAQALSLGLADWLKAEKDL